MSLFQLMKRAIATVLCPLKSVHYFEQYLWLVERLRLEHPHHQPFPSPPTAGVTHRVRPLATLCYLITNTALTLKAMHFVYLSTGQTWSDPSGHSAVHFDYLQQLVVGGSRLNLLGLPACLMLVYMNRWLGPRADLGLLTILSEVVLERRWSPLFGEGRGRGQSANSACDQVVRRTLLFTLNLFMSILASLLVVLSYSIVLFAIHLLNTPNLSTLLSDLAKGLLFASGSLCYGITLAHAVGLTFGLIGALLAVFFVRMRELARFGDRKLWGIHRHRNLHHHYHRYRRKHLETLGFFFRCNHFYGRLFVAFLGAMCPISIGLTVWLLAGQVPSTRSRVIFRLWIVYIMYLSFVLHVVLAQCSYLIHRPPARQWLTLAVVGLHNKCHHHHQKRYRIRLALDIQTWHVVKRYGFTYGIFGLVTLSTFTKVFKEFFVFK